MSFLKRRKRTQAGSVEARHAAVLKRYWNQTRLLLYGVSLLFAVGAALLFTHNRQGAGLALACCALVLTILMVAGELKIRREELPKSTLK